MKYGFIGTGHMGGALARALAQSVGGKKIFLSDREEKKASALASDLGVQTLSVREVAKTCGTVFLGVKPQNMAELLTEIQSALRENEGVLLVTMAAGLSMAEIRTMAGGEFPVIRIMPNMAVSVGEGMILYDRTENVSEEQLTRFLQDMAAAGRFSALREALIDAGSAVSGCGPAYVFLLLEALADGGVYCGLSRQQATLYAAQMVLGSARLLLESGKTPEELKDAVCSPGGTTIAGVRALEEQGFRAAAMDAVIAAYQRTLALGK